jgi:ligand-binding sensor domain-containing protein
VSAPAPGRLPLLLLGLLAAGAPARAVAQIGPGHWDPDDRVLVTDLSTVTALARSADRVFAATTGGLVEIRDVFRAWEPPLTREDGWPEAVVSAAAFSRTDATLWLAVMDGRLLALDPSSRRWTDEIPLDRRVRRLIPDDVSGTLLLATDSGWLRLDPFSRRIERASPAEAAEAIDRNPDLRARRDLIASPGFASVQAFLGEGPYGRSYDVTDVIPSDDPARFWVGTAGGGLALYDSFSQDWRAVPAGLWGRGASALALEGDAVWIAPSLPQDGRYGLTRVGPALDDWRIEPGSGAGDAPDLGVRALVRRDGTLWAAGERGLARRSRGGEWSNVARELGVGIPVLCLAAGEDAEGEILWLGGERGVVRFRPATGSAERLLDSGPVRSLHAAGDGVWAATDRGLVRISATGSVSAAAGLSPLPSAAVTGAGDTVWAGLDREVWRRAPGGEWSRVEALGRLSGPVTALAVHDGVLWAGGPEELLAWDARAMSLRRFSFAAGDLPTGPFGERGVSEILPVDRKRAWLALPAGALRLDADL